MKFYLPIALLCILSCLIPSRLAAQLPEVRTAVKSDVSIPFREMKPMKHPFWKKWTTENESEKEVPNRFHIKPVINPAFIGEPDGALQQTSANDNISAVIPTIKNFDGLNNSNNSGGRVTPPDPAGDVGPNHYVQAVNSMLRIFDKNGTSLYGPVTTATLWNGFSGNWDGHNDGDAVVIYDEQADRWVISQFAIDCSTVGGLYTEYQLVAVSTTPDPTGSYYRYAFQFDYMPDYPKMGVWHDGYYMAVNRFNTNTDGSFVGAGACVLNRTKMLAGDPTATMIYYKCETLGGSGSGLGSDCYSMLPGDCDGTFAAAASPNYFSYMNDNSWGGNDELRIWALKPDWTTPANSTMTFVNAVSVASFSLFTTGSDIVQKGTTLKLDCLDDRLMFRQQYRNMGTYESMVTCHSVNIGSNVGGVRWYEMRKSGSAWTLYQQGTYTLNDTKSRWMGSIAMNAAGDIALGFTVSNSATYPSIYFTGRKSTDTPGTMTITESPIVDGAYSMTGTATRWGDYAMMSVDPTDNMTFWHTNEYVYSGSGTWPWGTKTASFKFTTAPAAVTLAASSITGTTAVLNGTINPSGLASTYYFEYGTTASYGSTTTSSSAGSGSSAVNVSTSVSGLTAGLTYHFRVVGTSSGGTTYGSDLTFVPGLAAVTTTAASSIASTTAVSGGQVTTDGGVAVTARGVCWGTSSSPTVSGSHTTDGSGTGTFTSTLTGLTDNTLYYLRAYATNSTSTVYGNELVFTTASVSAPVATAGTGITSTAFVSNWNAADGAQSYKLDVSTSNTFTSGGTGSVIEGFNNGTTAPTGWTFTNIGGTYATAGNFGASSPSLKLDATGDIVQTISISAPATSLSFWIKGQNQTGCSLLVEGFNGSSWTTIQNITSLPNIATTITYNSSSTPALPANMLQFRFTYTKVTGNLAFDDVAINYSAVSTFVPGYENLSVSGLNQAVTGLTLNTPYYYRVRATGANSTSANSNVITVTTAAGAAPAAFTVSGSGSYCTGGSGVAVGLTGSESGVTYTLYKDNVAQTPTVAGTGSAISFGNQPAGNYTVKGTNAYGTTSMNGSAVVTTNALPTAFSVTGGGSYCSGSAGVTIGLSGSQSGVNYQLFNGASAAGAPVAGSGSAISFGLLTTEGTYTVTAVNASTSCSQNMTGSVSVSITPTVPVSISITPSANPVIEGSTVTFTANPVNGGTSPSYQWKVNGSNAGTGGITYTYIPLNGDIVTCVLTSNITCPSGNPATSGPVTMGTTRALNVKVFLEGPFNTGTALMETTLKTDNLLPLSQPYNTAPWNYAGTENVASIPADVVDWVLVDLRDATSPAAATSATRLSGWPRAYFLKKDGSIAGLDGSVPTVGNPSVAHNLYVVVKHRNHIAVISNAGLTNTGGTYSYDFSASINQAYGSANGYKQINSSLDLYGMVAGDADSDGNVYASDYTLWALGVGNTPVYWNADINLDASVYASDYTKWAINVGLNNSIDGKASPVYSTQVPE